MKHEKGQKFSQKHGSDVQVDPTINAKIEQNARNGRIACAVAFKVAEELEVSPADIGKAMDLAEVKLIKCQLGLFGYEPEKKAVKPKQPEDQNLTEAIGGALVDGKLSCRDAWDIAHRLKVPKMAVSAACEALHVKIKPCQLGAF